MFGESWWIQDDEIVVASHLFEIFESVFRISFVARIAWKVQFHVPVGQRDRFGRAVDRVNDLGSSPHGVEREAASVAEHVQYGASFGIAFQQRPVFALIDKETCLLPLLPVDTEFQAVLKSDVLHHRTGSRLRCLSWPCKAKSLPICNICSVKNLPTRLSGLRQSDGVHSAYRQNAPA